MRRGGEEEKKKKRWKKHTPSAKAGEGGRCGRAGESLTTRLWHFCVRNELKEAELFPFGQSSALMYWLHTIHILISFDVLAPHHTHSDQLWCTGSTPCTFWVSLSGTFLQLDKGCCELVLAVRLHTTLHDPADRMCQRQAPHLLLLCKSLWVPVIPLWKIKLKNLKKLNT